MGVEVGLPKYSLQDFPTISLQGAQSSGRECDFGFCSCISSSLASSLVLQQKQP